LLCHVLNYKRLDLYLNYDRPLSAEELSRFKALLKRRLDHEPLQYILGATEFMGLPIQVNSSVLIPRPDTEVLAEKTIETAASLAGKGRTPVILDIGTGSGAIAIAIAYYLAKKNISAEIHAVDISPEAVAAARVNAQRNGLEAHIVFHVADLRDAAFVNHYRNTCDLIVSNPPYISQEEFRQLPEEVRIFEPAIALLAEDDGLFYYKRIASISPELFNNRSTENFLLFETAYNQADSVNHILLERGFKNIEIIKDYSHIPRVVLGTWKA